jgi:Sortase domain
MTRWVAVLAVSLAVLLGVPLAWSLSRPAASAGMPLRQAIGTSSPSTDDGTTAPASAVPSASVSSASVPSPGSSPTRLRIAAIQVDAAVAPVGVDPNGTMVIPREAARVGWYRFGPAPGAAAGAAVLAGHVDSRDQGPGALYRLREVPVGATVEVVDAEGVSRRYRVVSRELITKKALPTQALFSRTGPARLILITCGGEFDAQLHSYRDNVVVVAQPQP